MSIQPFSDTDPGTPLGPPATLGRVVHYRFRLEGPSGLQPAGERAGLVVVRAADVVYVHDPEIAGDVGGGRVDLQVKLSPRDTIAQSATRGELAVRQQTDRDDPHAIGVWFWPPRH